MKKEGDSPKKALMQTGHREWLDEVEELSDDHYDEAEEQEEAEIADQDIPNSALSELRKLNQHMGQIEGKVNTLSSKYDRLSQSDSIETNPEDEQISADELVGESP